METRYTSHFSGLAEGPCFVARRLLLVLLVAGGS